MKTGIIQDSNVKKVLLTLTSNSNKIEFVSVIITDKTNCTCSVIYSHSFIVDPMEVVYTEIPINSIDYANSTPITAFEIEYIPSSECIKAKIDYAY